MTDATGTPSGTPGGNAGGDSGSRSFIAARAAQIQERMQTDPAYGGSREAEPAAADAGQPQPQPQPQPAQQPAAQQTVEQELAELRAFKAEADVRKNTLPSGPEKYEARLPADFVLPHGSRRPSFDEHNPALAMARQIAHAEGMSQQGFEKLLGVFATTQIPGQVQQQAELQRLREANMAQLGVTGHLRAEAVSSWMAARGGEEGRAFGNWLRQHPAAFIVKAMENIIKQGSSQRAASSQQTRESESANADTKIPGYSGLSMIQIRATQMAERMKNDPNYATGGRRGGRE